MLTNVLKQFFLFLFIFFFICFNSIGQRKKSLIVRERRPYISFGIGRSVPIADKLAVPEDSLSFAKPGIDFVCEATIVFTPFVGFKFSGGGIFNSIDLRAYEENLKVDLSARNFLGQYEARNGGWYTGYYLIGPMFSLPFKKVTFDFDLQAGATLSYKYPSELTLYHINGDIEKTKKEKGKGWSLGVSYGLCFRYTLSKKIALYTNTKMFLTVPEIKTKVNRVYNGNLVSSITEKHEQALVHWIVGLGIAYQVVK